MPRVALGVVVGGCRVDSVAGRGGMGVVYRAVQVRLDRPVAFKVISPELALNSVYRGRFQREARLAASIEHPNVLPVYEAGELDDGELYLVMRWVEGTDLRRLLAREDRLAAGRAVELLAPVARALDAAHARGLVHRDVKSANVLITEGDEPFSEHVYLTDFGIARGPGEDRGLTSTGAFLGTLAYAAPERIENDRGGPAADIYALGCVLFETLTGWPPFNRESELATMNAHLSDPIPTARTHAPDVPLELDEVIRTALAKDPAERFPSAGAMATALDNAIVGPSAKAASPEPQPEPTIHPHAQLHTTVKTELNPDQRPRGRSGQGRRGLRRWSRWRRRTSLATLAAAALATLGIILAGAGGPTPPSVRFRTVYTLAALQTVSDAVPAGSSALYFLADNDLVEVQPDKPAFIVHVGPPNIYLYGLGTHLLAREPSGRVWFSGQRGWQVIEPGTSDENGDADVTASFLSPMDPFGPYPWALAFGGGYGWVESFAHGSEIHMVNLRTDRAVGPAIPTPSSTFGLAYSPTGTLWALSNEAVTAIRGPDAGLSQPLRIRARGSAAAALPTSLAIYASGGLWIGTLRGLVVHLDAAGHPAGPPLVVGRGTTLVATAGDRIGVLDRTDDTLTSIRTFGAGRGAIQGRVSIPGARSPSTLACVPDECVITDQQGGADHQMSVVIEASF